MKISLARCATFLVYAAALVLNASRARIVTGAQGAKTSEAPAGNAENGKLLFTKYGCYECHGREGQGSTMTGPRIAPDPISFDAFVRYVRKPRGEMPPYTAQVIPDQELTDIYAFLKSRPHPPAPKSIPFLR